MPNKSRKDLSPEDELRLARLRYRCDALNMASVALEREEWGPNAGHDKGEVLRVLEEIREEANEPFARARREVGLAN